MNKILTFLTFGLLSMGICYAQGQYPVNPPNQGALTPPYASSNPIGSTALPWMALFLDTTGSGFATQYQNVALTANRLFTTPNANSNPVQPLSSGTSNESVQYIDSAGVQHLVSTATAGANSSITSLTGLTTPLSTPQGGTGTAKFTSGQATFLTSGSVAVTDATIDSSSIIVVTEAGTGSADHYSVAVVPTTGFTIYSSNASSDAVVNYIRVK